MLETAKDMFQSYQSKQINPDSKIQEKLGLPAKVSIVSIQTDQSRLEKLLKEKYKAELFQSYQSKQINPDTELRTKARCAWALFQSYQSKQINPDKTMVLIVP